MANSRCLSYKRRYTISIILVSLCLIFGSALFIAGGVIHSSDIHEKDVHKPNSCKVMESSYYETRCSGFRSSYVCYRPVWFVTYIIVQDSVPENYINATIEHDGFRLPEAAEDKRKQYQIGISYPCWCNVDYRSKARWDKPSIIIGVVILIAADIATILGLVGICYTYRARRILKMENEQLSVQQ